MDLANLAIGGVGIMGLIVAIVEGLKSFGIDGNNSKIAAFVLGLLFAGVALGIENTMIPAAIVPYIELVVKALTFALSATGFYDLLTKNLPTRISAAITGK